MTEFGNTLVIESLVPDVVQDDGGYEIVMSGDFKDSVASVDVIDNDGTVHICYSGKSGQGYSPRPMSPTVLRAVTPPLPAGGPYTLRVAQGASVVSIPMALTSVVRIRHAKVYEFRKRFPPWWDTGLRRMDLEDLLLAEESLVAKAYKTADEAETLDAVATLDSELLINVLAGKKYALYAMLRFNVASANPGVRAQIGGTATIGHKEGGVTARSNDNPITAIFDEHAIEDDVAIVYNPPNAGEVLVEVRATLEVTVGGTLGISWAQASSHADATTLLRGSFLELEVI